MRLINIKASVDMVSTVPQLTCASSVSRLSLRSTFDAQDDADDGKRKEMLREWVCGVGSSILGV